MATSCLNLDMIFEPQLWRLMGFWTSIVGFICFALGSSSQKLFGRWNLWKMVVYIIISSVFSLFMLYAIHLRQRFPKAFLLKLLVSFLVLLSTSLYSYYDDRADDRKTEEGKGHRSIMSLISFGSFALMSMSLSTQVQPGFEVGMSNFFLGGLVVGVMKKNFLLGLGVAVLCCIAIGIRDESERRRQARLRGELPGSSSRHSIPLDTVPSVSVSIVDETVSAISVPIPDDAVPILNDTIPSASRRPVTIRPNSSDSRRRLTHGRRNHNY